VALDLESLLQPLDPLPASGPQNPPPRPRQPFWWRVGQFVSAYLPLILMALLALATWWLVSNTPRPGLPRETAPPRHEPDYTMQDFTLQRFAADGALRVQVQGERLRHYPDTDTMEIDQATIRATAADGSVTVATARLAVANSDASQVQLQGGARVVRRETAAAPIEFESEFLHAFLDTERVTSHLPTRLRQGTSEMRVASLDYDNLSRTAKLGGPLRVIMNPPGAPSAHPPGGAPTADRQSRIRGGRLDAPASSPR
jgi:lipopolysaccharide export system protein LptC